MLKSIRVRRTRPLLASTLWQPCVKTVFVHKFDTLLKFSIFDLFCEDLFSFLRQNLRKLQMPMQTLRLPMQTLQQSKVQPHDPPTQWQMNQCSVKYL